MIYEFLAKIYTGFYLIKSKIIALIYQVLTPIWFRKIGNNCCFYSLPRFGYAFRDIKLGNNCSLGVGIFFNATANSYIQISSNVRINDYVYISAVYGIEIGEYSRIGEFVSIRDNDHVFSNTHQPIYTQGFTGKPIKIGSDVWIGRGVFIGKGVEIGGGAVIGANSVVTKSIPPFAVAVGSPAKVIKYRTQNAQFIKI